MISVVGLWLLCLLAGETAGGSASSGQRAQPVVVAGRVRSSVDTFPVTLAVNRVGFSQEELTAQPDARGYFSFHFTSYVPTDAWITYGANFLILVHPGDSIYVEFDGAANDPVSLLKSAVFQGDASAVNQSAALFQQLYYGSSLFNIDYARRQNRIMLSEPGAYMAYCDSVRRAGIAFQTAFVKKEKPADEVSSWSRFFIEGTYYSNASTYPGSHRRALVLKESEWDVPADYYDFLLKYPDAAHTLIGADAMDTYINRYTMLYMGRKARRDAATLHRPMSMEQQDSMLIQCIVKYTQDPLIREISLCYYLNSLLDESALELFEKNKATAQAILTQPFLINPLFEKYARKKKEIADRAQLAAVSLHSGVSFVDSLIQGNKGKVIYIDIWATWCGPCREEFPYARRLEDTFAGQVVFLYLCLDSKKNAYENLLRQYAHGGIHRFLDDTQSRLFKQHYKLDGFPHYMLIDKDGHLAYAGYTIRPSDDGTTPIIRGLTAR